MLTIRSEFRRLRTLAVAALFVVVLSASAAFAQEEKEKKQDAKPAAPPSTSELPLDQLLERALMANPDIRAARAKVEGAQVDLDRARLEVTRAVITARSALDAQKFQIEAAESRRMQATVLYEKMQAANERVPNTVSEGELSVATSRLAEADQMLKIEMAKLPDLKAQLNYLIGGERQSPGLTVSIPAMGEGSSTLTFITGFDTADTARSKANSEANDPLTESMRKQLVTLEDAKVKASFLETPLVDVLDYLQDFFQIRFVAHRPALEQLAIEYPEFFEKHGPLDAPVTLELGEVTFAGALAALQDQAPLLRFVVRPYGILVTCERAEPKGAITVEELFRQREE